MTIIKRIDALEMLDSRGFPTLYVAVETDQGHQGSAMTPSGASVGVHEVIEKRDHDKKRYNGKGLKQCLDVISRIISPSFRGRSVLQQEENDALLIALDGTKERSHLGGNTLLAVSLALARTKALVEQKPLYRTLCLDAQKEADMGLPVPMMNVINGGVHADNALEIQECMMIPSGASTYQESLRMGVEIYHALGNLLAKKGLGRSVGDEGGYAPAISHGVREALDVILKAGSQAGYQAGKDFFLALDLASSAFYHDGVYTMPSENLKGDASVMVSFLEGLVKDYPIISLEDGMDEDDWEGWRMLYRTLGERCHLVGDDLFVTSIERLKKGLASSDNTIAGNAILIKPNQVGTLTETLETMGYARDKGIATMISHRSGDTEDAFIADLAVGCGSGWIKTGAPARSERVSKYNRLLWIAHDWERFSGKPLPFGRKLDRNLS